MRLLSIRHSLLLFICGLNIYATACNESCITSLSFSVSESHSWYKWDEAPLTILLCWCVALLDLKVNIVDGEMKRGKDEVLKVNLGLLLNVSRIEFCNQMHPRQPSEDDFTSCWSFFSFLVNSPKSMLSMLRRSRTFCLIDDHFHDKINHLESALEEQPNQI